MNDMLEQMLLFYSDSQAGGIADSEKIKIKFEIDTNPPAFATYENRYQLLPSPYAIRLYDSHSLFAGKIHAVICRTWKDRIKGRDLYLMKGIKVNVPHLRSRLIQSEFIGEEAPCSVSDIKVMLHERFAEIDFLQAKKDVEPFIKDHAVLNVWNRDFFDKITDKLEAAD